ncbi:hypothetical protein CI105_06735 [Candidatus Izimaplasma bacterium ZiA1]|uniref:hypothetical protein n=1 Tax=Candidatus Izimoplasma sp. ZiA1 TaxID=2024899 RepID=UPI000BAA7618|nr:hypothetical protein CI105_06735 [Candidatus Izimaplasma bacterium ZiA1]
MKERLIVKRNEKTIFDNYSIELPIKKAYIIKKSLEVFNDDDPCIIHQSFVINDYVSQLLDLFGDKKTLYGKDVDLDFIDYMNIEELVFIKGE